MLNKHLKISGTSIDLTPTFDNPFEGYKDHNHPLTNLGRTNTVKESFQYVNESIYPVCITGTNGLQMEIRGGLRNLNRLVVIRTITFGSDIGIDLSNSSRILGEGGDEFVSYVSNVIEREVGNRDRTIVLYYVVDTTNLWGEPDGVYINQIGITVYSPVHASNVSMVNERRPVTIDDDGEPERTWGANIQLLHIPESNVNTRPAYVAVGNQLVEVDSVQIPGMKPGMHLITHGNARIAGNSANHYSTHIKPEDYKQNGIYESYQQLMEGIGGKDRAAEVASLLKSQDNSKPGQAPPSLSILDEVTIGGHSLRTYAATIGETIGVFNKVKDDVKNVGK